MQRHPFSRSQMWYIKYHIVNILKINGVIIWALIFYYDLLEEKTSEFLVKGEW